MQDEQITVSPLDNLTDLQSYSRKQFYDEQLSSSTSKQELAVHVVAVFVVTSAGEIILQKRSNTKRHNPRLIDKTLGGHITFGDEPDYTVLVETVQELLTPSIVLRNQADFAKTYSLLKKYLDTVALIKHNQVKNFLLNKVADNKEYKVNNVVHTYFGIYNGSTKPADREASGMLYYNLSELEEEISLNPDQFTDDIKQLFKAYKSELLNFAQKFAK